MSKKTATPNSLAEGEDAYSDTRAATPCCVEHAQAAPELVLSSGLLPAGVLLQAAECREGAEDEGGGEVELAAVGVGLVDRGASPT